MSFELAALLATWVALLILALGLAGILRQIAMLAARPPNALDHHSGPPVGSQAPSVPLGARPGAPVVLVFLDTVCSSCERLLPTLLDSALRDESRSYFLVYADHIPEGIPDSVAVLPDRQLFAAYRVPATPYAVLLGADRRIVRASPVGSVPLLERFIEQERQKVVEA